MISQAGSGYGLFDVVGIELEYVVVDEDLKPRCLLEDAFRGVHGHPTSEIQRGDIGFSNELAAHVFEIKNREPQGSLAVAEAQLVEGLGFFAEVLRERFGARLLPTGMHPFMRPSDTKLWQRANRAIYETYARIFSIQAHGWLNVQASHVNLPFGSEAETVLLHNATACLLPYLPALAASSPVYEGEIGPSVDNRLEFYKTNQRAIPVITGRVIPEYITSYADYRRNVFRPIRESLDGHLGADRLRPEWVNSRGAIMRFSRRALEIKVLDVQECVKADIAIAVFIRGALRYLTRRLRAGTLRLPEHGMLVEDLDSVIRDGTQARVHAAHLRPPSMKELGSTTARSVLGDLLEQVPAEIAADELPYLTLVADRIQRGSLSERIRYRLSKRTGRGVALPLAIREVYTELMNCLQRNSPWPD
ncbi:MAG: hypothetical protein JSU87_05030 [Gemmatimonadota bacterium]|nr:MAG: hypothetical protein JSU87_05030 [Gemmatimonadota bacterium]